MRATPISPVSVGAEDEADLSVEGLWYKERLPSVVVWVLGAILADALDHHGVRLHEGFRPVSQESRSDRAAARCPRGINRMANASSASRHRGPSCMSTTASKTRRESASMSQKCKYQGPLLFTIYLPGIKQASFSRV